MSTAEAALEAANGTATKWWQWPGWKALAVVVGALSLLSGAAKYITDAKADAAEAKAGVKEVLSRLDTLEHDVREALMLRSVKEANRAHSP